MNSSGDVRADSVVDFSAISPPALPLFDLAMAYHSQPAQGAAAYAQTVSETASLSLQPSQVSAITEESGYQCSSDSAGCIIVDYPYVMAPLEDYENSSNEMTSGTPESSRPTFDEPSSPVSGEPSSPVSGGSSDQAIQAALARLS